MDPVGVGLMLETEFRDEAYTDGFQTTATKERIFRESILLDLRGDIYHSRLVEYRARLDLGLQQQFVNRNTSAGDERNDLDNNQYDLRAFLLPESPYTGELFGVRSQVRTRQSFFPTSDAVITRYGANVRAREWVLPSWLHYDHYVYEGRVGDDRRERRENLQLQGSNTSHRLSAQYKLEYNNIDSSIISAPYDDYQANAGIGWSFGQDLGSRLDLSGNYRRQTGEFQSETGNVITGLKLELTDELQWDSRVAMDQTRYGNTNGMPTDKIDWNSLLHHSLFKSLESSVGIRGFRQSFGEGSIKRDGIFALLDYHKKTSFGEFRFEVRPDYFVQDEEGNPDLRITVSDEGHRVPATRLVVLDNLRVDRATIRIKDATGLIVYVEPADYTVAQVGLTTRITISVSSRITVGQLILVSYQHFATSSKRYSSFNNQTSLGITFLEFSDLEFRWGRVEQRLLEGRPDGTLEHSDEIAVLFNVHYQSAAAHFEWLNRNSNLNPITRISAGVSLGQPVMENLNLHGSASWFETHFKDTGQRDWGFNLTGTTGWRITNEMTFDLLALFQKADQISDEGRGWFVEGKLLYDLRDTIFMLRLTASQERWQLQSDQDVLRAYFMIKRQF